MSEVVYTSFYSQVHIPIVQMGDVEVGKDDGLNTKFPQHHVPRERAFA